MDYSSVSQTAIKFLLKTDGDVDRKRYAGWMGIGEKTANRMMNYMRPGEVLIYDGKVKRDEFGEIDIPIYPFAYLDWADVSPSVVPSDIDRLATLIRSRSDDISKAFSRERKAHMPIPTQPAPAPAPQVKTQATPSMPRPQTTEGQLFTQAMQDDFVKKHVENYMKKKERGE
jgi:hypothetical protein